jgi:hypothetical protein
MNKAKRRNRNIEHRVLRIRVSPAAARRIRKLLKAEPHWTSATHIGNYAMLRGLKVTEQLTKASKA